MFNHPYAADVLAAQHRRELQTSADRTRLARQATRRQTLRHDPPADRANHRWTLWPSRHHRRRTVANPT
jgi:hypothetical protein